MAISTIKYDKNITLKEAKYMLVIFENLDQHKWTNPQTYSRSQSEDVCQSKK